MSLTPLWSTPREGERITRMQKQKYLIDNSTNKLSFHISFIRKMYWADWGNHPKIETAAMDGTMRETLVEENIQWPTEIGRAHV